MPKQAPPPIFNKPDGRESSKVGKNTGSELMVMRQRLVAREWNVDLIYSMAEGPVQTEPLSGQNSLITGGNTGTTQNIHVCYSKLFA
jgi:hypothetical protein